MTKKGYVVAVHTQSEEEALEACSILDDDGAIDVNDHSSKHFSTLVNDDEVNDEVEDKTI